jgi:hypothetical protein
MLGADVAGGVRWPGHRTVEVGAGRHLLGRRQPRAAVLHPARDCPPGPNAWRADGLLHVVARRETRTGPASSQDRGGATATLRTPRRGSVPRGEERTFGRFQIDTLEAVNRAMPADMPGAVPGTPETRVYGTLHYGRPPTCMPAPGTCCPAARARLTASPFTRCSRNRTRSAATSMACTTPARVLPAAGRVATGRARSTPPASIRTPTRSRCKWTAGGSSAAAPATPPAWAAPRATRRRNRSPWKSRNRRCGTRHAWAFPVAPGAGCPRTYNGSGACIGSIRPSPRVIFLNSARDTDT